MRRRAVGALILLATAACGDASAPTQTVGLGAEPAPQAPLEAVLESWDAIIGDLPAEWMQHDEWIVEGAETAWDTECPAFNRLAELFGRDSPKVVVWRAEGVEVTHRVASLDWDAPAYVANVRGLADACPEFEVAGVGVELRPLDDPVIASEPNAETATVELSAYPLPDPSKPGATPKFDPDRRGYLIVLTRHNVVSQLVIGVEDSAGLELVDGIVAAADRALQSAPIEATGPFPAPTSAPTLPSQRVDGVELRVDRVDCRNDGGFTISGIEFALAEGVPLEWREIDPLVGEVVIDGTSAVFTGPDGQTASLGSDGVPADCPWWGNDESPAAAPEVIGRLDCTGRGIAEVRVADDGQSPQSLAGDAQPDVVAVAAGDPLQWWGVDDAGVVVVGVFLGDAPGADYQVFTCAPG